MSALQRVIYRVVNAFSGRKLAAFDTAEEAKAWLVLQQPGQGAEDAQPHS